MGWVLTVDIPIMLVDIPIMLMANPPPTHTSTHTHTHKKKISISDKSNIAHLMDICHNIIVNVIFPLIHGHVEWISLSLKFTCEIPSHEVFKVFQGLCSSLLQYFSISLVIQPAWTTSKFQLQNITPPGPSSKYGATHDATQVNNNVNITEEIDKPEQTGVTARWMKQSHLSRPNLGVLSQPCPPK